MISKTWFLVAVLVGILSLASLACGLADPNAPKQPVAPIRLGGGLASLDVCQAIPREDIEAVMGRKLTSSPEAWNYEINGANGCSYDGGKDAGGNAYFGYVIFTPLEAYNSQPLYKDKAVTDLGREAYFNNGADARQLWVKVNDNTALVVAFGDRPNENGALAIAKLVLAAIQP